MDKTIQLSMGMTTIRFCGGIVGEVKSMVYFLGVLICAGE
jgi:hypothetical protein